MISFTVPGEAPSTPNLMWRIERLSVPEPNTGCWLWLGDSVRGGYGRIRLGKTKVLAHRAALAANIGTLSSVDLVLHSCDQPSCVNPDHLRVGTHAENMAERNRKGRQAKGDRHPRLSGEACGTSRLTNSQVREIRRIYSSGSMSQQTIATVFGIGQTTVSTIVRRVRWSHLP